MKPRRGRYEGRGFRQVEHPPCQWDVNRPLLPGPADPGSRAPSVVRPARGRRQGDRIRAHIDRAAHKKHDRYWIDLHDAAAAPRPAGDAASRFDERRMMDPQRPLEAATFAPARGVAARCATRTAARWARQADDGCRIPPREDYGRPAGRLHAPRRRRRAADLRRRVTCTSTDPGMRRDDDLEARVRTAGAGWRRSSEISEAESKLPPSTRSLPTSRPTRAGSKATTSGRAWKKISSCRESRTRKRAAEAERSRRTHTSTWAHERWQNPPRGSAQNEPVTDTGARTCSHSAVESTRQALRG